MSEPTPAIDAVTAANAAFAAEFSADLAAPPSRQLAVVTCMDARIPVFEAFGLANGEAHVIRTAGGVVTDDVIRSLCISQRALGTTELLVIHHSRCGMQGITDDGFKADLEADLGVKPPWAVETFTALDADVRQSMRRIANSPFIAEKGAVRGFVYDVDSGELNEVMSA